MSHSPSQGTTKNTIILTLRFTPSKHFINSGGYPTWSIEGKYHHYSPDFFFILNPKKNGGLVQMTFPNFKQVKNLSFQVPLGLSGVYKNHPKSKVKPRFHPAIVGLRIFETNRYIHRIKQHHTIILYGNIIELSKKSALDMYMDVSENRGTPKSSILIGFSIINHPFWGTPIFGNTHMHLFKRKKTPFPPWLSFQLRCPTTAGRSLHKRKTKASNWQAAAVGTHNTNHLYEKGGSKDTENPFQNSKKCVLDNFFLKSAGLDSYPTTQLGKFHQKLGKKH